MNSVDASVFFIAPELFKLDTLETLPEGMVRVPGWTQVVADGESVRYEDYLLGRHEVTNADFKAFVDAGGYEDPRFWEPIARDGTILPFEEAMKLFVDRTGQRGPSTWEAGDFPEGQGTHPVGGVSWYEAAAYALFKGAELPTAGHWRHALPLAELAWVLPASNLDATGTIAVERSDALNFSGTFDMTGNVREWTVTKRGPGERRLILGGGWADHSSEAIDVVTAPPLDRSPTNGFRLAATRDDPAVAELARAPLLEPTANPTEQPPVSDEVYATYGNAYSYDRAAPLKVAVEAKESTRLWTRERITFDAAYGGERMAMYLYVPTASPPPYQTVIYWPGGSAQLLESIDDYSSYMDFVVKSGRAVAFPVYQGTFERRHARPFSGRKAAALDVVQGVKDLRRSIDYMETRPDLERGSIAFFGHSWGGQNAAVVLAQEPRIRTAIIYVGFLPTLPVDGEVDPINSLPRVHQPVLMLNSEFDGFVPLENALRYFELLGTPPNDKKHVISKGGHFVPRELLIRESLEWLDEHLGRARG
jgi:dienelactone hydrolase